MSTKDDLHTLIHSLSGNEKRYFRLNSSADATYMQLFDALLEQPQYDEAVLGLRFSNEKWWPRLASEKNYLLRRILKSMRAFREEKDLRQRIRALIADGEFLWRRNLYKRAAKTFLLAKDLAAPVEDKMALLEISRWERRFPQYIKGLAVDVAGQSVLEEQVELLDKLNEEFRYLAIYDQTIRPLLKLYRLTDPKEKLRLVELLEDPLLAPEAQPGSFSARRYFLQIMGVAHKLLGNTRVSMAYFREGLRHWKQNPNMVETNFQAMLTTMNNYLSIALELEEYNAIPTALQHLPQDKAMREHERTTIERIENYYSLLYRINAPEDVASGLPGIQDIADWYGRNKSRLPKSTRVLFCYNIAVSHFVIGDFSGVLYWVRDFEQVKESGIREDAVRSMALLELLGRYELEQYEVVKSRLRAIRRKKAPQVELSPAGKAVLPYLDKLCGLPPATESIAIRAMLEDEIGKLSAGADRALLRHWLDLR